MQFPITIFTTSLLLILYLFLSFAIISYRRKSKISLGDGGDLTFQRKIRAHGNFAEYTPILLFCLFLLELNNLNILYLYILSLIILLSRFSHAFALSSAKPKPFFRVFGMSATFTVFILFIFFSVLAF